MAQGENAGVLDPANRLSLRQMLSIPYRVEACTTETANGWSRLAAYPELPGCTAEAPTIEAALSRLERRRIEIIVAMLRAGHHPPVPRPPLRGCDPEGVAAELGLSELVAGLLDHDVSEKDDDDAVP